MRCLGFGVWVLYLKGRPELVLFTRWINREFTIIIIIIVIIICPLIFFLA